MRDPGSLASELYIAKFVQFEVDGSTCLFFALTVITRIRRLRLSRKNRVTLAFGCSAKIMVTVLYLARYRSVVKFRSQAFSSTNFHELLFYKILQLTNSSVSISRDSSLSLGIVRDSVLFYFIYKILSISINEFRLPEYTYAETSPAIFTDFYTFSL